MGQDKGSVRDQLLEKVSGVVVRGAMTLPDRAQRLLAGRPDVRNGMQLSTETQLMLRLQKAARVPAAETLPWEEARAEIARQSRMVGGNQPIGSVRDFAIEGPGGQLPLRLYTPTSRLSEHAVPTMLFIHGGGMVYGGDFGSHDAAARFYAEETGVQLIAVDYRLAPEHPFPAAVDDCIAAFEWIVNHPDKVNADIDRLAVGGDSAGGYLSATTAILATERGLPLKFQWLIYPCTDFVNLSASRRSLSEGYFLTGRFMDQARDAFFADEAARHDPLGSILLHEALPDGLPAAFVATAGFDPLRDEGEAYARKLAEAGVSVEAKRYDGMIHGFMNIVGAGRSALANNRDIAQRLRRGLN